MPVTSSPNYNPEQMSQLIAVARQAIKDYFSGTRHAQPLSDYDRELQANGACFVTLEVNHLLQGCLGSLIAYIPLVEEVYNKAHSACYQDHRFSPLEESQLEQLTIEVSVLSQPVDLPVSNEQMLIDYLKQHPFGVILSEGSRRAVFLPQVWKQLPQADQFLDHLKIKGGWPGDYWSTHMKIEIFTVTNAKEVF
jgi:AmmeMemoRadiSam system protein A